MFRLIYSSRTHGDLSADEISAILKSARRRNEVEGITGLLLYHNRRILQVLEGPEHAVDACYDRISRDARHTDVRLVSRKPARSALFSKWFMDYEVPDDLVASGHRAMLTLDQLNARLEEVAGIQTTEGKAAAIRALKQYLQAADRQPAPA